jgi:hypothetical protein
MEGGSTLNRGSEWRRWEPHIHAPGTVINNQFSGPNAWSDYLTALKNATPVIEAIAVTDYYVTETYEEVLRHKAAGRLPAVKLTRLLIITSLLGTLVLKHRDR